MSGDMDAAPSRCRCGRRCAPGRETCSLECDGTPMRGYSLLPGDKTERRCRGWISAFGTQIGCARAAKHVEQCATCGAAEQRAQRMARARRERELTRTLRNTTYGPGDGDEFKGFE